MQNLEMALKSVYILKYLKTLKKKTLHFGFIFSPYTF